MKKVKTNLRKSVHMFSSMEEIKKQYAHDVKVMGEQLNDYVYQFDPRNPYDQEVLSAILTNILAWIQVHADWENFNMTPVFKKKYETALKKYRELDNRVKM